MSKPVKFRKHLSSLLGLTLFVALAYISVVVFCLVALNSQDPTHLNEDSTTWRVLSTITPIHHHHDAVAVSRYRHLGLSTGELADHVEPWPGEQIGIDVHADRIVVHVIGTTRARAMTMVESARQRIRNALDQTPPDTSSIPHDGS